MNSNSCPDWFCRNIINNSSPVTQLSFQKANGCLGSQLLIHHAIIIFTPFFSNITGISYVHHIKCSTEVQTNEF